MFQLCISIIPALPFLPSSTFICKTYAADLLSASVEITQGLDAEWDFCQRTIACPAVQSIAVSHEGMWVATASELGMQVWDMSTGLLMTTVDHSPTGTALAFSADGCVLGFGDFAAPDRWGVWHALQDSVMAFSLDNCQDVVPSCCAFSYGIDRIACAFEHTSPSLSTLHIWGMAAQTAELALGCEGVVRQVSFSHSDHMVFAATNFALYIWNSVTGEQLKSIGRSQVSFPPNSWHFFTKDDRSIVHVLAQYSQPYSSDQASLGVFISSTDGNGVSAPTSVPSSLRVSALAHDGKYLAVRIEDTVYPRFCHGVHLSRLSQNDHPLCAVTGTYSEIHLISSSGITIFDLSKANYELIGRRNSGGQTRSDHVLLESWKGKESYVLGEHVTMSVGGRDTTMSRIRFIDTHKAQHTIWTERVDDDHRDKVLFAPNSQAIAYRCSSSSPINIMDVHTGISHLVEMQDCGNSIVAWAFSPGASFLAVAFRTEIIQRFRFCVWHAATAGFVGEKVIEGLGQSSIVFSPNEALIVVVSHNRTKVEVFSLSEPTGGLHCFRTYDAPQYSWLFSPAFADASTFIYVCVLRQGTCAVPVALYVQSIAEHGTAYASPIGSYNVGEGHLSNGNLILGVFASPNLERIVTRGSVNTQILEYSKARASKLIARNTSSTSKCSLDTVTWSNVHFTSDGWLHVGESRVCWIPVRYRPKQRRADGSSAQQHQDPGSSSDEILPENAAQGFRALGNGVVLMCGNKHVVLRFHKAKVESFE
ncbi:hypothetical protein CONPUDRAFT_156267 [Coniophora puteana RWD-64-598 SS2]|uniref:WD40 repeat-like protein n=1 Tax=Coniophora puteana (strain RWD-64-598) TaxID=741705 RepID=A0A5M3MG99_CONPW|nr:uncharacterized protein CONPUDRAFT_156267 [Coniophora puteana RWD-64-598 SS2]EIW78268.1 hypothetical protein CONPUDRAFT_156267 [Coniophora puteana RWD-64-598 SS2]